MSTGIWYEKSDPGSGCTRGGGCATVTIGATGPVGPDDGAKERRGEYTANAIEPLAGSKTAGKPAVESGTDENRLLKAGNCDSAWTG